MILITVLSFTSDVFLASLATYYLKEVLNIEISPILFNEKKNFVFREFITANLLYLMLVIVLAVITIYSSGSNIVQMRHVGIFAIIITVINSFIVSIAEETFVRIFLFGLLFYFLRKLKLRAAIAIILSSFTWSLDHF